MKKILIIILSGAVIVSCSRKSAAGKPGRRGELVPSQKSRTFVAERPFGMVTIPGGSYVMGMSDQDFTETPTKAPLKTVTVSSFFMDEAETTNAQYREFINYVRDSVARTMLAEVAGEGEESTGRGGSIGDYAYMAVQEGEELTPYEEYLEAQGAEKIGYGTNRLNWDVPLHWKTSDYPDVEYAEVIESMYLPASVSGGKRMLDARKLRYAFEGSSLVIYPDTTVWKRDFEYAYNEPLFEQYFWHPAYKDYPVVGVTWNQARAYCDFRTKLKTDYLNGLKKKKSSPLAFRLPTEAEWEYAARGGKENATYPWGGPYLMDDRGCYLANFKPQRGSYIEDPKLNNYTYTAPVKKFRKNDYGLYDMAGNVAEWTLSPYNNSSYVYTNTLNPANTNTDIRKTVRGGSWKDIGYALMVGARDWERMDSAHSYIGFRTVQQLPEASKRRVNRLTR